MKQFDYIEDLIKNGKLKDIQVDTTWSKILPPCTSKFSHYNDLMHKLSDKLFKVIERKWNEAGYEMPKLIFWNVCSRTNTIPLTANKQGVVLVSGFSPAIVKVVLNGELDPYKALIKEITGERYKQVTLTV